MKRDLFNELKEGFGALKSARKDKITLRRMRKRKSFAPCNRRTPPDSMPTICSKPPSAPWKSPSRRAKRRR